MALPRRWDRHNTFLDSVNDDDRYQCHRQVTIRLPPLATSATANDDENENISDDDDDDDDDDVDMASSSYDTRSSPHYSLSSETHSNSEGDDTESNERRAVEQYRTAFTSNSSMYEDTSSETSCSEADNTFAQDTTTTDDDDDIDTTGDTHTTDGQDDDDNTSTSTSTTMSITNQQQLHTASALLTSPAICDSISCNNWRALNCPNRLCGRCCVLWVDSVVYCSRHHPRFGLDSA